MNIRVYCGMYSGNYKWQNTENYEPDECDWEDIVEINWDDEYNMPFDFISCKKCGSLLDDISHYMREYERAILFQGV